MVIIAYSSYHNLFNFPQKLLCSKEIQYRTFNLCYQKLLFKTAVTTDADAMAEFS